VVVNATKNLHSINPKTWSAVRPAHRQ
jgi:hypothetical protein